MGLLIIIIVIGLIWYTKAVGFNIGCIVGGVIGAVVGSSLGIAGSGGASNGLVVFAAIGFIVGGLIFKNINQK